MKSLKCVAALLLIAVNMVLVVLIINSAIQIVFERGIDYGRRTCTVIERTK
jgi:hypothetical protein